MAIYAVTSTKYDAAAIAKIVSDAKAAVLAKTNAADIKLKAEFTAAKAANQYIGCYNDSPTARTFERVLSVSGDPLECFKLAR